MRVVHAPREFVALESAEGILLAIAAAAALLALYALNRSGVSRRAPYFFVGLVLWMSVLKSGVPLRGVGIGAFLEPVSLGIVAGLLAGKPIGVSLASWLVVRLGFARLPEGAGWGAIFGASVLCGIGFTMSLFIAGLAFEGAGSEYVVQTRLGVLFGLLASAVLGLAILRGVLPPPPTAS